MIQFPYRSKITLAVTLVMLYGCDAEESQKQSTNQTNPKSETVTTVIPASESTEPIALSISNDQSDSGKCGPRTKKVVNQCRVCHSMSNKEPEKTGPNLHGIIGQQAGTAEGFRFSPAFRALEFSWSDETLDAFLKDVRGYVPNNRMAYSGLSNPEDRSAIICYLNSLK